MFWQMPTLCSDSSNQTNTQILLPIVAFYFENIYDLVSSRISSTHYISCKSLGSTPGLQNLSDHCKCFDIHPLISPRSFAPGNLHSTLFLWVRLLLILHPGKFRHVGFSMTSLFHGTPCLWSQMAGLHRVYGSPTFFTHCSINSHLHCFHIWVSVDNAVTTEIQNFCDFISFSYPPSNATARSHDSSIVNFFEEPPPYCFLQWL